MRRFGRATRRDRERKMRRIKHPAGPPAKRRPSCRRGWPIARTRICQRCSGCAIARPMAAMTPAATKDQKANPNRQLARNGSTFRSGTLCRIVTRINSRPPAIDAASAPKIAGYAIAPKVRATAYRLGAGFGCAFVLHDNRSRNPYAMRLMTTSAITVIRSLRS